MEKDVWSVNGAVTFAKATKLHGLLSGEGFDLTTEPGIKLNIPFRGIVIKDKAWVCSYGETWEYHLTHHGYETVAFYQLCGGKWEDLRSQTDGLADEAYLAVAIRTTTHGSCAIGLMLSLQSFMRLAMRGAQANSSQLSSSP